MGSCCVKGMKSKKFILALTTLQYPLTNKTKLDICRHFSVYRCLTFRILVDAMKSCEQYSMSVNKIVLYMEMRKAVSVSLTKHSLAAYAKQNTWTILQLDHVEHCHDICKLYGVHMDHISDEQYGAERWIYRPESRQLQTERIGAKYDTILFELDVTKHDLMNHLAWCFSLMWMNKKIELCAQAFLKEHLNIKRAECISNNGIVHMCLSLKKKLCLYDIENVVRRWNEMNIMLQREDLCLILCRQLDCCVPLEGVCYKPSSFYIHCVKPMHHDDTREIWFGF
jgi:hypothetical protein